MLTLVTTLKSFRVSRASVEERFNVRLNEAHVIYLSSRYAQVLELLAALKKEPYSSNVLSDLCFELLDNDASANNDGFFVGEDAVFTINCSDGPLDLVNYTKEALARHFLLIRGFIEDHPEAKSIDINCTVADVRAVIGVMMDADTEVLTPNLIYTLQLLTPATDLYYLFFNLSRTADTFIVDILSRITEEERKDLLLSYGLLSRFAGNEREYLPLPQEGEGLNVAFVFPRILERILHKDIPTLTTHCHSFVFLTSYAFDTGLAFKKGLLLQRVYDDDSGVLSNECHSRLVTSLVEIALLHCIGEERCTILKMLGVRHESIPHDGPVAYAPYQVTLRRGSLSKRWWEDMRRRVGERVVADRLLEPYIV